MKKYRMKDPKKAALLKAWADVWHVGQESLDEQATDGMLNGNPDSFLIFYAYNTGENLLPMIIFPRHDFVEVKEYNPNEWNDYPAVLPPIGVLMRVEFVETEGKDEPESHYIAASFNGEAWCHYDGFLANVEINEFRFRPWE